MSVPVFPNTFLIGIQKAGTTTLDDWMSQHPEIYCYETLKDIHLFARFKSKEAILQRLSKEPSPYRQQPVVLQSAVNYIYYPRLMQEISNYAPDAKLICIIRNPVDRAISSYNYFRKMLRETRAMREALIYNPKQTGGAFSSDNSDFTYIEHGFYGEQLEACLQLFKREQLLILDYEDLSVNPDVLLKKLFNFLGVDTGFKPDMQAKNVTGSVKNQFVQQTVIQRKSPLRKWFVDNILDPVLPVGKRKKLKQKIFEWNTGKVRAVETAPESKEEVLSIKKQLEPHFYADTKKLDQLLGTDYSGKWFLNKADLSAPVQIKTQL